MESVVMVGVILKRVGMPGTVFICALKAGMYAE